MPLRAAILLVAALVWPWPGHAETIEAPEVLALAERGEIVIVDVRTPAERAETGVPPGALEVPLQDATGQASWEFVDRLLDALNGSQDQPLALICATGVRSALAQRMLVARGFSEVQHIEEGMLGGAGGPGWLRRDLPVEDCRIC